MLLTAVGEEHKEIQFSAVLLEDDETSSRGFRFGVFRVFCVEASSDLQRLLLLVWNRLRLLLRENGQPLVLACD